MIVDCISDLHGYQPELRGGDLLIVAGDLTANDKPHQILQFCLWVDSQKYKKKIVIAGNHDMLLEEYPQCLNLEDISFSYLCDSGTEFERLKIWGSPWTRTFKGINPKCKAFTLDTEEELHKKWSLIPDDIDILVTHSPFLHTLDQNKDGYHCGSSSLKKAIDRIKTKLFVCGHIHEQGGNQIVYRNEGHKTWCVNASHVNEKYEPVNKPIRIEL